MVFNGLNKLLRANLYCEPVTDLTEANSPEVQHRDAAQINFAKCSPERKSAWQNTVIKKMRSYDLYKIVT